MGVMGFIDFERWCYVFWTSGRVKFIAYSSMVPLDFVEIHPFFDMHEEIQLYHYVYTYIYIHTYIYIYISVLYNAYPHTFYVSTPINRGWLTSQSCTHKQ